MARPPRFDVLTGDQLSRTLGQRLIPIADLLRNLLTRFGLRTYVVHLVRVSWSSGKRNSGSPTVTCDTPILPTPEVSDLTALQAMLQPGGQAEQGTVTLYGISGRYTEEFLRGFDEEGRPPGPQESFFYEIEFLRTDGRDSFRRRFALAAPPTFQAGKLRWVVSLERTRADRKPNGDVI